MIKKKKNAKVLSFLFLYLNVLCKCKISHQHERERENDVGRLTLSWLTALSLSEGIGRVACKFKASVDELIPGDVL